MVALDLEEGREVGEVLAHLSLNLGPNKLMLPQPRQKNTQHNIDESLSKRHWKRGEVCERVDVGGVLEVAEHCACIVFQARGGDTDEGLAVHEREHQLIQSLVNYN